MGPPERGVCPHRPSHPGLAGVVRLANPTARACDWFYCVWHTGTKRYAQPHTKNNNFVKIASGNARLAAREKDCIYTAIPRPVLEHLHTHERTHIAHPYTACTQRRHNNKQPNVPNSHDILSHSKCPMCVCQCFATHSFVVPKCVLLLLSVNMQSKLQPLSHED